MKKGDNIKYIGIGIIVIIIILALIFVRPDARNGEEPKSLINQEDIISGGPPKDGIPSIDNPLFVSSAEANLWIEDNELVLALEYKNTTRIYPLQIMVWHEIVNDEIEGDPILITYCPLCGSGIAYESKIEIDGVKQTSEFGTSGKLYNSNLIMYDRLTDSYWTQIDGLAVVGELTGQELKAISIDTVSWREWKNSENFEKSEVLSKNTGFSRSYGQDPYGSYYEDSFLIFPVENNDNRIHPKTPVLGIEINNEFKAYKEQDVKDLKIIEDEVSGVKIRLQAKDSGIITIINIETDEEIVKERDFWFAWYAFHPETELYIIEE